MRCSQCGQENQGTSAFCNACGSPVQGGYGPGPSPQVVYVEGGKTGTSGMAIAGFVLSFFCGLLGLIFSIMGYNEVKRSDGRITGEGLAIAGIIISILSMLVGILMAVAR